MADKQFTEFASFGIVTTLGQWQPGGGHVYQRFVFVVQGPQVQKDPAFQCAKGIVKFVE